MENEEQAMNIIGVLDTEIKKWNNPTWNGDTRCGLCWKFVPGGRTDYFNNIQIRDGEECCVYVGVLKISHRSGFITEGADGTFVRKPYCDWIIQLIAGIPSRLDIQFYNENPSHPESEGKWEKYINPIFQCLGGCCVEFDLCDIHNCAGNNTTVEPVRWESEMVMNYKDLNLDGVLVSATFREWFS